MTFWLFWLLNSIFLVFCGSSRPNCQSCYPTKPEALNIHVIPHSHLDVGWIKTFEQYYWGSRPKISKTSVRNIFESVITALMQNPKRRFIFAESAYIHKWWNLATKTSKRKFWNLIKEGRLEIVGGGWTMNDEACTNYQSIIDQFTIGLKFLNETFGNCGVPTIVWQIDPFGHSREMASIASQMGYEAIFLGRIDHKDKMTRFNSKTAELIWRGNPNLGDASDIFVSILFNGYIPPSPFCFGPECFDNPIIYDKHSPEYNYEEITSIFAEYIALEAECYVNNHIMMVIGGDFWYEDASGIFYNIDTLIEGLTLFNHSYKGLPMNAIYSTPSCYIEAIKKQSQLKEMSYFMKSDDFFPYANDLNSFWTGYYTSRPTSKRFERDSNNILQVAKQISTFIPLNEERLKDLRFTQEAVAIMQHHDAITGTEKQHVADDYHKMLTEAFQKSVVQVSSVLSILIPFEPSDNFDLELNYCLYANVSICSISEDGNFLIAVYNPLSYIVSHYIRLPVSMECFEIFGPNGSTIDYDIFPTIDDFPQFQRLSLPYEMVFFAEDLPPLGLKIYEVRENKNRCMPCIEADMNPSRFSLGDDQIGFEVDENNGYIKKATLDGISINLKQEFLYYVSARGDNSYYATRASGAYIFRSDNKIKDAVPFLNDFHTATFRGNLVEEFRQEINSWITQIIRVYKKVDYLEFDWLVGPVDIRDFDGKEIISRFTTNLNTNDTFYTDSNGRQTIKRKRNYRPTFQLDDKENISSNYYPVTSKISLKDEEKNLEFAVITDRSQGASSLKSGEVEVMIHRRILLDDGLGVYEALDEEQFGQGLVVRGKHWITFGQIKHQTRKIGEIIKRLEQNKLMTPLPFLTKYTTLSNLLKKEISGLSRQLPRNVQILTLEPWRPNEETILLRLEYVFEANEDSKIVSVSLTGLFTFFDIIKSEEMTLAANQIFDYENKLKWNICGKLEDNNLTIPFNNTSEGQKNKRNSNLFIELNPMEIRTFILTVKYK